MNNAISALETTVSADALWGVFGNVVPYIGVIVLVSLGFYLIRRMLKGVSTTKTKI